MKEEAANIKDELTSIMVSYQAPPVPSALCFCLVHSQAAALPPPSAPQAVAPPPPPTPPVAAPILLSGVSFPVKWTK